MVSKIVNGLSLKPAFIYTLAAGLIGCGIWLGATDIRQQSTKDALDRHMSIEAHGNAQKRITTLEAHYFYIQRDLKEIKELLKGRKGN